jgi:formate dehydrogenase subunit delta
MSSGDDRLAYMADQIARNFLALGHNAAVAATADHIATFWDPSMRSSAFAMLNAEDARLTPLAADALRLLRTRGAPPSQTQASTFAPSDQPTDRSDAG